MINKQLEAAPYLKNGVSVKLHTFKNTDTEQTTVLAVAIAVYTYSSFKLRPASWNSVFNLESFKL